MKPLWNTFVVAGTGPNAKSFIGNTDLHGTVFEDNIMATGYGAYMALPIMRNKWRADMSQTEAIQLLEECLRVLYFRDARSTAEIQLAKATAEGVQVTPAYRIDRDEDWAFGHQVLGI